MANEIESVAIETATVALCPACGSLPGCCYLICPTQDPFQGDQEAENNEYEANARFDFIHETYGAYVSDYENDD